MLPLLLRFLHLRSCRYFFGSSKSHEPPGSEVKVSGLSARFIRHTGLLGAGG